MITIQGRCELATKNRTSIRTRTESTILVLRL